MGVFANVPFALASGLGINAIVAFDIILAQRGRRGRSAMACVVIEGVIAVVLVLAGLREAVVRAVPLSLKLAIGVGIGLFITLVGLREGGIVVNNPATGIGLGDLTAGPPLIALGRHARRARAGGARASAARSSAGIATSVVLGLIFGVLEAPDGVADVPGLGRLLDDRRRARPDEPRRRADLGARPGDLRAVHDRLLRHGRDGGRGRARRAG